MLDLNIDMKCKAGLILLLHERQAMLVISPLWATCWSWQETVNPDIDTTQTDFSPKVIQESLLISRVHFTFLYYMQNLDT